jgi:ATP-binding protein involved in chromosome partitioning
MSAAPGGMARPAMNPDSKIKHLLAVASGKGGVGKSTVAINLAIALHKLGLNVGLVDADVLGPTIPRLAGCNFSAASAPELPVEKFGIALVSSAFMLPAGQANIMRGPRIGGLVVALVTQIPWGELDFLIIDLPPGTGDAPLSLCQAVQLTGVLIVTMPQEVSVEIVRRGMNMFQELRVPILGLVENMSYYTDADGNRQHLFGEGGGRRCAAEFGVPLLGQIPLDPRIAAGGDKGEPITVSHPESPAAVAFAELAAKVRAGVAAAAAREQPLPSVEL